MKNINKYIINFLNYWFLILLLFSVTSSAFSQGFSEKNIIYLIGQVTNSQNGAPIEGQEIFIVADTTYNTHFHYTNTVFSDKDGFYYDTIATYDLKGALMVYTYDYLDVYHDTTVYFRFNWSEENILFANFILPVELISISYQANFNYISDPSGHDPFEFQFYDNTNSNQVITWHWNFGDGNFSNQPNPLHEYTKQGLYKVKLTVQIQPTPHCKPYVSSIVKFVNVTTKDYHFIGGHVFATYFPIDIGYAYLYKINGKEIVPIDTAIFNDTLGFYLFPQVIEGQYFVKADLDPNSVLLNKFMATYYSDKLFWTEADTIFHNAPNSEYDIQLAPVGQYLTGPGKISGTITYGYEPDKNKLFPAFNVELLLLNQNNEPIICCHSNEEGEFIFCDLELSSYKVHAEVTGKYTYPVDVTLNENNPEVTNVEITISTTVNGGVNGIEDFDWINNIGEIYPNPVSEISNLDINLSETTDIQISLYNISGQLIREHSQTAYAGRNTVKINVSGLLQGVYFLKIKDNNNKEVIRKFIKQE